MDFDYEQFFTHHFIVKNKRERLQFELLNESRRQRAISRFDHGAIKYIDKRKIIYSGNDILWSDLKNLIEKNTDEQRCYVISSDEEIDRTMIKVKDLFDCVIGLGRASIMVFTNMAIIETEQVQGPAMKYVLKL
ncbi:MAG: hypothetical protein K2K56_14540 [Lachnospiraceae bacterium]|nr:hypothetical protein [Lachnospiraceae bacterium]